MDKIEYPINFFLDFPPSVNNYYHRTHRGVFIKKKGREYREKVRIDILQQCSGVHITTPISLKIVLHPPTLRKYDIDNFNKALLDSLTHCGFWFDDSLIDQLLIFRGCKIKNGRVNLEVKKADAIVNI